MDLYYVKENAGIEKGALERSLSKAFIILLRNKIDNFNIAVSSKEVLKEKEIEKIFNKTIARSLINKGKSMYRVYVTNKDNKNPYVEGGIMMNA